MRVGHRRDPRRDTHHFIATDLSPRGLDALQNRGQVKWPAGATANENIPTPHRRTPATVEEQLPGSSFSHFFSKPIAVQVGDQSRMYADTRQKPEASASCYVQVLPSRSSKCCMIGRAIDAPHRYPGGTSTSPFGPLPEVWYGRLKRGDQVEGERMTEKVVWQLANCRYERLRRTLFFDGVFAGKVSRTGPVAAL